ncbi:MAG: alpha/beta hydrolase [Curvibacter lanceolatus]|uniref:alpha/beta fold hydrolase n=1 Tax=Curvibacter lanceolatus TaxID=86182 RepID=UPI0003A21F61|nr:alpha/beta hydrolase [Curvibacter lanceolatus]MBV5294408.1 alpha/beta hydrolase [Curvibacter lanceolatus]
MNDPTLNYVSCPDADGGHRMAYWAWGDAQAGHVIVCVHGLSRQGRDFDVLAQDLVARAGHPVRVICPDVVGRGQSDRLVNAAHYQIPQYAADMVALLAQLQQQSPVTCLDWIGTSMGGLIGMVLAGQPGIPLPQPVHRLVLNDVGPVIQWSALQRIGTYLGQPVQFADEKQAAAALWLISTGFGPHTREQWLALTRPMLRELPGGGLGLHYDPAIALPFRALQEEDALRGEAALWQLYDQIQARTLLLRGAQSDLLSPSTAQAMAERGPHARVVELAGVGHAPTLIAQDQRDTLVNFIFAAEAPLS